MADMQNLVERLERAVGRLEAVSQASGTRCGYADGAAKGKQHTSQQNTLSGEYLVSWPEILLSQYIPSFGANSLKRLI